MMNKSRQPRLGEAVHYVSYGTPDGEYSSECRAAVVTGTNRGQSGRLTGLFVMNPTGIFFNDCAHDEDRAPGSFHFEH